MTINASLSDFPPFISLETFFKNYKEAGIDGIELITGVKSRWNIQYIVSLSKHYDLPICSIHQPIWSGLDIYRDEGFIALAQKIGVKTIVCHPLERVLLYSEKMTQYFQQLVHFQEKYGVTILLENMESTSQTKIFNYLFPKEEAKASLDEIYTVASEYQFKINFDTSHARLVSPQEDKIFQKIYPLIENIHLSSFSSHNDHLPLQLGEFHSKEFLHFLQKKQYTGLITFEIFYPSMWSLGTYDFASLKESTAIVRSVIGKSS